MKKQKVFYLLFIVVLLFNIYYLGLYIQSNKKNKLLNQYIEKIRRDKLEEMDNLISELLKEQTIREMNLKEMQNCVVLRLPKDICLPCLNDFFISLSNAEIKENSSLIVLTSFSNDRKVQELQSQMSFKCINVPGLKLAFKFEQLQMPYFFIKKNNKFIFPIIPGVGLRNLTNYFDAIDKK
jgi:hypothetical protein